MNENRQLTAAEVARTVEDVAPFDPGIKGYRMANLGDAIKFGDVMSKAGEMLPEHLRGKPALCMAVTMRAVQWGFDPFALAAETFQAKSGGVIGYQAKVFAAALHNCAGITLQYEFEGEVEILDKPVTSPRGNQIAARTATGSRRCIASAKVDGLVLTYETPTLDQITIKNSPLWHNDPDQQLAYYAARGWTRRHRPSVIMGAYSADEVADMPAAGLKDVTPEPSGFARLAEKARQQAVGGATDGPDAGEPNTTEENDKDALPPSEDGTDQPEAEEPDEEREEAIADAFRLGAEAAASGDARGACPYTDDPDLAEQWFAGFDEVHEQEPSE